MQIRTFRAPSISKALDQVRKELGPDAIILGNKQIALSPEESIVEVRAAADPGGRDGAAADLGTRHSERDMQIQDDIREIKGFLSLLISSKDQLPKLRAEEPLAEVFYSLLTRGIEEKQVLLLLGRVLDSSDHQRLDKKDIIEGVSQLLLERLRFSRPFQSLQPTGRTAHTYAFLGPTGVGKTTTLAKVAAYLRIKRRLDVGVISIDTYRIGAVDQLQTYANILDVPFLVAQDRDAFRRAREKLSGCDVVLVDTTGKNFLHRKYVEDLFSVFEDQQGIEHFLVLSATAKDEDLRQTIIHFRGFALQSLIFTKIDETLHHGGVINQALRFPYSLSYFGTGQRVPEDIELATPRRLLSFLFQLK